MSSTFERVRGIVAEQLGIELGMIRSDSTWYEMLPDDSLDHVEIILAVEEAFGVSVRDADAERIATVGELVRYLDNGCRLVESLPVPSAPPPPDEAVLPRPTAR